MPPRNSSRRIHQFKRPGRVRSGPGDSDVHAIVKHRRNTTPVPEVQRQFVSKENLNLRVINPWVQDATITAANDKFLCTKPYVRLDRAAVAAYVVDEEMDDAEEASEFAQRATTSSREVFSVTGLVQVLIRVVNSVYFSNVFGTVSSLATDFVPLCHMNALFRLADRPTVPGVVDGFTDMVLWMLQATLANELVFKRVFMHHVNFRSVVEFPAVARMMAAIPLGVFASMESIEDLRAIMTTYARNESNCRWLDEYVEDFTIDGIVAYLVRTVAGQLTGPALIQRLHVATFTHALLRAPFIPQLPFLLALQPIADAFFGKTASVIATHLGFMPPSTYNMDRPDEYMDIFHELLTGLLCLLHSDYEFRHTEFARLRGEMVYIPNTYNGPWASPIQELMDMVLGVFCSHGIQEKDGVAGMDIIHHSGDMNPWRVQACIDSVWYPVQEVFRPNWWAGFLDACRQALVHQGCAFSEFAMPVVNPGKCRRRRRLCSQIAIVDVRNVVMGVATEWIGTCPSGLSMYLMSHVLSPYFVMTSDNHTTLLARGPIHPNRR